MKNLGPDTAYIRFRLDSGTTAVYTQDVHTLPPDEVWYHLQFSHHLENLTATATVDYPLV